MDHCSSISVGFTPPVPLPFNNYNETPESCGAAIWRNFASVLFLAPDITTDISCLCLGQDILPSESLDVEQLGTVIAEWCTHQLHTRHCEPRMFDMLAVSPESSQIIEVQCRLAFMFSTA